MRVDVTIQRATRQRGLPSDRQFRRWVSAVLHGAGHRRSTELTIRLVNEAEGRRLNHRWRRRDYATNVLSFPAGLPQDLHSPLLGDLVICAPVVRREAAQQGKLPEAHWAHLTVHGTLHLLGYDHVGKRKAAKMESLETAILGKLGFSDPYAA
ncbi:MAG: rRNA maturation RNase YbeY [Gammaproteobacteria bacterium]|nr:rRNA maturation RNase YbeY [Gammaproteobacteria bacterium]